MCVKEGRKGTRKVLFLDLGRFSVFLPNMNGGMRVKMLTVRMCCVFVVGLRRQVVKTIEKITGTMKLVAQAQLLGTTRKAKETSTFFLNVQQMMQKFPLPNVEEGKQKTITAVISSNRGLCGSLNSQLVRDVIRMPETQGDAEFFVFGDKGATVRGEVFAKISIIVIVDWNLTRCYS